MRGVLATTEDFQLRGLVVGRCRLTPGSPWVHRAWFPRMYLEYDESLSNSAFIQLAPLHGGAREVAARDRHRQRARGRLGTWYDTVGGRQQRDAARGFGAGAGSARGAAEQPQR